MYTQIHTLTQRGLDTHTEKSLWLQCCLKINSYLFSIHFNFFSFQSLLSRWAGFYRFCCFCFCGGSSDHNKNTHQANRESAEVHNCTCEHPHTLTQSVTGQQEVMNVFMWLEKHFEHGYLVHWKKSAFGALMTVPQYHFSCSFTAQSLLSWCQRSDLFIGFL